MGVRTIQMKIYQMHDYDLTRYYVSLSNSGESGNQSRLSHIMKELLISHVRGTEYTVPQIEKHSSIEPKNVVRIRFTLDENKEADIISYLKQIKRRQINGFLKNLLRENIGYSLLSGYFHCNDESVQANVVFFEENKSEKNHRPKRKPGIKMVSKKTKMPSDAMEIKEKPNEEDTNIKNVIHNKEEDISLTTEYVEQKIEQKPIEKSIQPPEPKQNTTDETEQNFDFFGEIDKLMGGF